MTSSPSRSTLLALGFAGALSLLARPASAAKCGYELCGTNTADLRGTAIEGLNVNDLPNADGVRLVRGSVVFTRTFSNSACWSSFGTGYSIAVQSGQLLARAEPPSTATIGGSCLLGATFEIEAPIRELVGTTTIPTWRTVLRQIRIKINARNDVSTWEYVSARRTTVPTYELLDVESGISICPLSEPWMETWQTGGMVENANPPGVPGQRWHAATDHAMIVQGETYTDAASVDVLRSSPDWFNIACAGSAIAKARLMGYDPMSSFGSAAERQSTLKMLTAHYVRDNSRSWTETGTPLVWTSNRSVAGQPEYYGWPSKLPTGPREAYWNSDGVSCISHLRLWRVGSTGEAAKAAEVRTLARVDSCSNTAPTGTFWRTTTVDHVD